MTARKAAHSLQRAKGALASGFATVDLHHATGHDPGEERQEVNLSVRVMCVAPVDRGAKAAKTRFSTATRLHPDLDPN